VWRGGPPKQRLWLGPGRYRSGRRDAGPNAKRFAHSCVKRYSLRRDDTNSDANANCNGTGYCHPNSNSNSNSDNDSNSDSHSHSYAFFHP
jgi:hypothetical protein